MAEIVNLNRFRKDKARADKKAQADENAVKFGRSKSDKALETAKVEKFIRDLDAHKTDE
ncbi:DUF4169 family protein [Epibacterium sp. SM1979]|uniref:DUF4169 family protein n=1 Tax=Tritonibacter litoralis TaxID=2662264 RepID=A0A843YDY2_9RHOB|nr:DUF4169 family protein [Tritonibacter litoralis]MQQ07299.1 DUF4169 family protein [Tritonibacter litoralis]